jgi:hypothetical protein
VAQPTAAQLRAAGLVKLRLGARGRRVDLVAPPFSNSTRVTNPLFPIARIRSAVLHGRVEGKSFRTETTLLRDTRILEWMDGQCVEVLVSQYLAYSGGRIEEVALDLYAQDDAGSVWYLGEDVFNYDDGAIAQTAGTWFAGQDGPAALIMPARPKVGDVYRPENIAGLVFEEVTVKAWARPWRVLAAPSEARSSSRSSTTTARGSGRRSHPATASSSPARAATSRRWRWPCPPMRAAVRSRHRCGLSRPRRSARLSRRSPEAGRAPARRCGR